MSNYPELSFIGIQNPPVQGVQQQEQIYEIVDPVARAAAASVGNNLLAWKGDAVPNVAYIPAGVVVTYNDTDYTGTMQPDDPNVQTKSRYLVYRGQTESGDNLYQEYIVVQDPQDDENIWWEPLGFQNVNLEDLGQLAFADAVILEKGNGVDVLGKNTNFSATAPNVTVTPSEKGLKAKATGTQVGTTGSQSMLEDITPQTKSFMKSVSRTKMKMEKANVRGVTGTETDASKVTVGVAGKLKKQSIKKITNSSQVAYPSVSTSYDGQNKRLTFNITNGVLPVFADQDVATGDFAGNGDSEGVTIPSVSEQNVKVPIQASSSQEVATGSLVAESTVNAGATVVTEVEAKTTDKEEAVYNIQKTPRNIPTGVEVTQQPTITIEEKAKDAGDVNVVGGIQSASATAPTVSASNNDIQKVPAHAALSVQAGDIPDYDDVPM